MSDLSEMFSIKNDCFYETNLKSFNLFSAAKDIFKCQLIALTRKFKKAILLAIARSFFKTSIYYDSSSAQLLIFKQAQLCEAIPPYTILNLHTLVPLGHHRHAFRIFSVSRAVSVSALCPGLSQ